MEFPPPKSLPRIGLVIPSYRVRPHILDVLSRIGPDVALIVVVDDACPENSGALVKSSTRDERISVVTHKRNQGVGGATLTGYRACLEAGMDIIVKMDGDGQMDPERIADLIAPIADGEADYCKGNRFYDLDLLSQMPPI